MRTRVSTTTRAGPPRVVVVIDYIQSARNFTARRIREMHLAGTSNAADGQLTRDISNVSVLGWRPDGCTRSLIHRCTARRRSLQADTADGLVTTATVISNVSDVVRVCVVERLLG